MPLSKAWFSYTNLVRAATTTVSADSAVTTQPITNIPDRLDYRIYRSEDENVVISIDFGSAVTWQAWSLVFPAHRDPVGTCPDEIATTDTYQIQFSNVAAGNNELLDVTNNFDVIRQRGYQTYIADTALTGQYMTITITATSRATLNYIDLAYLHVGPIFSPGCNFNVGSTISFPEESLKNVSPIGGATFVESRARLLTFDGVWSMIEGTELDTWLEMQEQTGITQPILFGTDDNTPLSRTAFVATFDGEIAFAIGQNKRHSARVALKENR